MFALVFQINPQKEVCRDHNWRSGCLINIVFLISQFLEIFVAETATKCSLIFWYKRRSISHIIWSCNVISWISYRLSSSPISNVLDTTSTECEFGLVGYQNLLPKFKFSDNRLDILQATWSLSRKNSLRVSCISYATKIQPSKFAATFFHWLYNAEHDVDMMHLRSR